MYINASNYTPVDSTFMTTGEIASVEGTPFDFRKMKLIGDDIDSDNEQVRNGHGFDHNWGLDTKGDDTVLAA
ncbi:galactose-1-epimerase, partial [Acinetobacter pittii]